MSDFDEAAERAAFEKWCEKPSLHIDEIPARQAAESLPDFIERSINEFGIQAWLARAHLSHEENARLRAFARDVIREHQLETEGIQDLAVKHGLLAPVEATERCGEDCACAEYGDFPQTCYRMTSALAPKEGSDEPQP